MFSENTWKVILLVAASVAAAEPSRALSLVYQKPYKNVMFIPRNYYRRRARQSRILFLDDAENHRVGGRGEIDLTLDKNFSKIKFDEGSDYEFTSPEDGTESLRTEAPIPSGNERFYEPVHRFRPYQTQPHYYQGRFGRAYAPTYGFDPFQSVPYSPSVRTGYYPGWKARSPRVVFPYASDSVTVQTNSHAGPAVDNVVFREQNFGLNDIVDDQNLQDIGSAGLGSGDGFPDKGQSKRHRLHQL